MQESVRRSDFEVGDSGADNRRGRPAALVFVIVDLSVQFRAQVLSAGGRGVQPNGGRIHAAYKQEAARTTGKIHTC